MVLVWVAVRPAVNRALHAQIQSLQIFVELPIPIALSLRRRCVDRIDELRVVHAEMFPEDDEEEGGENEFTATGAAYNCRHHEH